MWDCLWIAPRLWTGGATSRLIEDAAIASQGGRITYVGAANDLPRLATPFYNLVYQALVR